jgi:hypothetical protein
MGHASAVMTMRYMQHAPESYFAEDAARVAASLTGERDRERSARSSLVRETRKPGGGRRQQKRAHTSDYKIDYSGISDRAAQSGRT